MKWSAKAIDYLTQPIPGHLLGLFRIIFGGFMVFEMYLYLKMDLVSNAYILPQALLGYFDFVQPLPEFALNALLYLMLLCAVLITIGAFFRPACFVFAGVFLYFLFLDKAIFNNHIYLFILLAFTLGFTHADRFVSIKSLRNKADSSVFKIQRWELFLIQLHFAIVYFYGGLAKLNPDWLFRLQPVKYMVEVYPDSGLLASWLKLGFQPAALAYGGLIFDLVIPFLLWWKRTRWWSLAPLLYFHISNALTFNDIGIFPFIMMLSTVIFFDESELPVLRGLAKQKPKQITLLDSSAWAKKIVVGYVVFQLLFPFRGLFLPNPVNWTLIANRFAWRMKSQSRKTETVAFTIQDGPNGQKMPVELNRFLNTAQIGILTQDVAAVSSFAKALARQGKAQGMSIPMVYANIRVSWNGYPPANTVRPDVELSGVEFSPFKKLDWVMPVPDGK